MVVRTNLLAHNSHRNLGLVGNMQARASRNLSSGFRINSAADDAAGLAISEGMRAQIRGMAQAARNTQDGISLIQTAEGFMNTLTELAQRARELAVQGANDTNNPVQRAYIETELGHLAMEMNRIWNTASFNGQGLFTSVVGTASSGLLAGSFMLQIGPDGASHQALEVTQFVSANISALTSMLGSSIASDISNISSGIFGVTLAIGQSSTSLGHSDFQTIISHIDNSLLVNINNLRASLGAIQNRLEFTIQNLDISRENLSAAESRIRDADMALEMMRLTQANVLQQAATAMLAQGNQAPQSILQLLG